MDLDYEKDMFIDESALDVEWLNQPTLMGRYCRALAKAEREMMLIKEKQKVLHATLDKEIRSNPDKFHINKITEEAVKNTIILNKDYRELSEEFIEAQYEVNMIQGAVDSIKQRKDALQDLVKLHGQQYFAGPSVPRDISSEAKQRFAKEAANKAVKITRTKKKK